MIWSPQRIGLIASVMLMVGCTVEVPPEHGQERFTVRDSAGISIAESTAPTWTEETAWKISREPILVIGSRTAEEPGTDFGFIQGATRLDDGRIVVAESMSREIRWFDSDGKLLFTVGGPGEGPSEFRGSPLIRVIHGDSIIAADFEGSKLVVFGPEGGLGRTGRTPPLVWNGLMGVGVAGFLRDGSFLVSHAPQTSDLPPGRSIVERQYHLFDPSGNHLGEFFRIPFFEANPSLPMYMRHGAPKELE